MTQEERRTLLIEYLDVCNTALVANQHSFPYKQILAAAERVFGGRRMGLIVYEDDPDVPVAYFTVRFAGNQIEPAAEGKLDPDFSAKIKQSYMTKVVKHRQEYIDHPAKLDWEWLKSRLGVDRYGEEATLVRDVMTPIVHSVPAEATVREAALMMQTLDVGVLPVVSGKTVVGILTDRDIVSRVVAPGLVPEKTIVNEVLSRGVISCRDDATLEDAARKMQEEKIRRVLVVNAEDRPVGILSLSDLAIRGQKPGLAGSTIAQVCESPVPTAV